MAEVQPPAPAAQPITFDVPEELAAGLPHVKTFVKDGKLDLTAIENSQVAARQKISELGEAAKAAAAPPADAGDKLTIPDAAAAGSQSIEQILAAVGHTEETALAELAANEGKLTQDTYLKLAANGQPRALVDEVLEGKAAKAELGQYQATTARNQAVDLAGGEPQLQALLGWVRSSGTFNDAQITALQGQLDNASLAPLAVQTIMAAHQNALGAGNAQPLISGTAAGGGGLRITKANVNEVFKMAAGGDEQAQAAMVEAAKNGELTAASI